jgi:hypothetical protein
MSNIKVNITELLQVLDDTPPEHNIMLIGNHGIGKSEILTKYYSDKGLKVVALFLGQMSDPGDLIGLPHKNEDTGKTDFMPPYWFPIDGKPIVLFLDELNRARPEILQTIMDLALNRKLAGRELPEGSRVISAVNAGDQYQLTDLDPALVSRFNIVVFQPTVQEWLLWAKKASLDPRVISFIEENPFWLDKDPDRKENADTGLEKTPDRRAWKRVSDVLKGVEDISSAKLKTISSIVGAKGASVFYKSLSSRKLITGKDVLEDFYKAKTVLEKYALHDLSVINDSIFRVLETGDLMDGKKMADNLIAYFTFLAGKKKEAAAHFANLYIQQTYPAAVQFIAMNAPRVSSDLIKYIQGI